MKTFLESEVFNVALHKLSVQEGKKNPVISQHCLHMSLQVTFSSHCNIHDSTFLMCCKLAENGSGFGHLPACFFKSFLLEGFK